MPEDIFHVILPKHPQETYKVKFYSKPDGERRVSVKLFGIERSWKLKEGQATSPKMAEIAVGWYKKARIEAPNSKEK